MPAEKDPVASVPHNIDRWTAGRKAAVVLDLIKGKVTAADVARQHGLTVAEIGTRGRSSIVKCVHITLLPDLRNSNHIRR